MDRIIGPEDIEVMMNENSVRVGNEIVRMTPREIELLYLLHRRFGRCVHKDALLSGLYGMASDPPVSDVLRVYSSHLRKKIKPLGLTIESYSKRGYALKPIDAC